MCFLFLNPEERNVLVASWGQQRVAWSHGAAGRPPRFETPQPPTGLGLEAATESTSEPKTEPPPEPENPSTQKRNLKCGSRFHSNFVFFTIFPYFE